VPRRRACAVIAAAALASLMLQGCSHHPSAQQIIVPTAGAEPGTLVLSENNWSYTAPGGSPSGYINYTAPRTATTTIRVGDTILVEANSPEVTSSDPTLVSQTGEATDQYGSNVILLKALAPGSATLTAQPPKCVGTVGCVAPITAELTISPS